ncbi:MAG TPA: hypothetical protein VG106_10725 [Vicinamibacterales bacterium]|nr:hypothetical protein [Vicinamibacterales bacterium]
MKKHPLIIGTPVKVELIELVEPGGPSGEPEQWGFVFDERLCLVSQVLDGWGCGESQFLEIAVQDGRRFMLRHDPAADEWCASPLLRPTEGA